MPKLAGHHKLDDTMWDDFKKMAEENPDFIKKILQSIGGKKQSNFGLLPEERITRKITQDAEA